MFQLLRHTDTALSNCHHDKHTCTRHRFHIPSPCAHSHHLTQSGPNTGGHNGTLTHAQVLIKNAGTDRRVSMGSWTAIQGCGCVKQRHSVMQVYALHCSVQMNLSKHTSVYLIFATCFFPQPDCLSLTGMKEKWGVREGSFKVHRYIYTEIKTE